MVTLNCLPPYIHILLLIGLILRVNQEGSALQNPRQLTQAPERHFKYINGSYIYIPVITTPIHPFKSNPLIFLFFFSKFIMKKILFIHLG